MYPVLFKIGPFAVGPFTIELPLYSFGALMATAALMAGWVVWSELKRYRYNPEIASTIVIAAAVGGLIGARLFFIFEAWPHFIRAPLDFILTGAGFTWYGGLFGGALAVTWVVRQNGIPWLRAADICAPALAIAYGVGRIGCHVAGDGDWGVVSDAPWAVAYTNAIVGWVHPLTRVPYPAGIRVHPTPIYELIQSLIIFAILWSLRKKDYPHGSIFWLYLVLAGIARFMVEFWRVNPVVGLGMTQAQWISIILALMGGSMFWSTITRPQT